MNRIEENIDTVLIVDDLPENIEILGTVLRKNKYKVAVAMNGEEALAISRKIIPGLILLDISMPGMDGLAVCRALKENPLTAGIPVIFVTAKAEGEDVVKGFAAGAVDYITKPFRSPELLMRVKTHITIRRLQSELIYANETLEKKVEERTKELKEAKEKAELADRLKSEFLSQISHEIRTPLNAVISSSSLIVSEMLEASDEDIKPLFLNLRAGSRRIIRTVDLILNMAQVHTNSYFLVNEKIDLNEVLSTLAGKYGELASEKNLAFKVVPGSTPAYIYGDHYSVSEIFEQLLDNAVNFTHMGSIQFSLSEEEERVIVSVEDTGVGISDEYLPKLYAYFSQEEGGYSRRFEGNGLGLALAKKYCEFNKAYIKVESRKNEGTRFTVSFPKYSF